MGLDMYLYASIYLSKFDKDDRADQIRALFPEIYKSGNLDSVEVKFEIGYWRKANQIHKWFVDNVQEGKDECQESYVSRNDLQNLKGLCEEALQSKEPQIVLPATKGFFFGSTEYDERYRDDLKRTLQIISKALTLPKSFDFKYHSSW